MSTPPPGERPASPKPRHRRNSRYGSGSEYFDTAHNRYVAVLLVYEEGVSQARRKLCFGKTPEAARAARDLERRKQTGDFDPTTATVAEYLTAYIADHGGWSERTRRYHQETLLPHLLPRLGKIRLRALTARQIADWIAEKQRAGTGATVLHNAFELLNAACAYAVRLGELEANRCDRVDRPPRGTPHPAALSAEQARALLAAAQTGRHYALILLLLQTGLRLGEALGLRWPDVTLGKGRGVLRVEQALSGREAGGLQLQAPKTPGSRREVVLVEPLLTALAARRKAQMAERTAAGATWQEPIPYLIFTTQTGQPYDRHAIARALAGACKRAGVPAVSAHDLRRTWATLQADAGAAVHAIRDGLGHTTNRMALHYVQRAGAEQGAALAERMAAILGVDAAATEGHEDSPANG